MAATGYTPIQLYYSTTASTAPLAGNLVSGELAINILDEKLYFKNSSGTVKVLASSASVADNVTVGTTTVTSGTSGYVLYNNAGTLGNLATTGSGNVVLATSPTLVTPVLGTPTSGTLTNCTGYTTANLSGTISLTSQVSGTLAIANGGTNITTYTTGDTLYASATNVLSKLGIGTSGQVLTVSGGVPTWATPASTGLTVGTTSVTSGTSGYILYNNAGTLGNLANTGTGNNVLATLPTFGGTGINFSGSTSGTTTLLATAVAGTTTLTLPAATDTLVGKATTDTLTNKTISGASNTITNVSLTSGVTGTLPIANGGTNSTATPTSNGVAYGTGTAIAYTAAGTTGQVLTATTGGAPTWATAGGSSFPAGTRMSFQQTSAPTGWTKDTTAAINDSILRLVTGSVTTGGTTAFSTWNAQTATGATTLSTTQIPSHTHSYTVAGGGANANGPEQSFLNSTSPATTGATGGGGSHTHSLTQSIKYYDFIIASKD